MGQVCDFGLPSEGGIDRVVDIAAVRGRAASHESAMLIARSQMSPELLARAIPINGEHIKTDGIGEHAIPPRNVAGEATGGFGVDKPHTPRISGRGNRAAQNRRRNSDLHNRPDSPETASALTFAVAGHITRDGTSSQQHVCEQICTDLIGRALITRLALESGISYFGIIYLGTSVFTRVAVAFCDCVRLSFLGEGFGTLS